MTGADVALDTSAAILLLNDQDRAAHFLSTVGDVYVPATTVGELLFGALNSRHPQANGPRYRAFLRNCRTISVDDRIAAQYAESGLALKRLGKPIPEADLWIAASAICSNLPPATNDTHFDAIPNLVRHSYNWTAPL